MSGTETILLIVLGFSLASLIALFMGRMLWTAAVKVGVRRMQRQVPSSLVGLQTERDRLRAEYAMLAQRLGARLEDAKLRLAENMAEVSRHRNRIQQIESSESERVAELRKLRGRVKDLELALADSQSKESDLRQSLAAKEEALRKLRAKRGYEGRERPQPSAPATRAAPPSPTDDAEIRLRQRIEKLSELARSRNAEVPAPTATAAAAPPETPLSPLDDEGAEQIAGRLAEAERQTKELEAELHRLEAEWVAPGRKETPLQPEQKAPEPADQGDNVILLPNRSRDLKAGASSAS